LAHAPPEFGSTSGPCFGATPARLGMMPSIEVTPVRAPAFVLKPGTAKSHMSKPCAGQNWDARRPSLAYAPPEFGSDFGPSFGATPARLGIMLGIEVTPVRAPGIGPKTGTAKIPYEQARCGPELGLHVAQCCWRMRPASHPGSARHYVGYCGDPNAGASCRPQNWNHKKLYEQARCGPELGPHVGHCWLSGVCAAISRFCSPDSGAM
jgi:hypothetical protein